jgi:hypothetical protein
MKRFKDFIQKQKLVGALSCKSQVKITSELKELMSMNVVITMLLYCYCFGMYCINFGQSVVVTSCNCIIV